MTGAASPLRLRRLADVVATPWKNGGGLTRELLCWPSAESWQLRISVAEVARGGAFSAYPGVMRWFCVLQGAGVRLRMPGASGELRLTPASPPLVFDGTLAPDCSLVDGPTLDLNLMCHGGHAELARAEAGQPWASTSPWRGLFTLHGATLHGAGPQPLALPAGTLAYAAAVGASAWQISDTHSAAADWWLAHDPHAR